MAVNSAIVVGNLTRDPEVRRTQSGMPIVSLGIAVNERKKDQQSGQWVDDPQYFDVVCFGERFEKLSQYMTKGTKLTVQGRLRQSRWEKDGQKRSKVEIVANDIELPPRQRRQSQPEYVEAEVYDSPAPVIDASPSVYDDDIPF